MKKPFFLIAIAFVALLFAACSKHSDDSGNIISPRLIVGKWNFQGDTATVVSNGVVVVQVSFPNTNNEVYQFNSNGTGQQTNSVSGLSTFTYTINNNVLSIINDPSAAGYSPVPIVYTIMELTSTRLVLYFDRTTKDVTGAVNGSTATLYFTK